MMTISAFCKKTQFIAKLFTPAAPYIVYHLFMKSQTFIYPAITRLGWWQESFTQY